MQMMPSLTVFTLLFLLESLGQSLPPVHFCLVIPALLCFHFTLPFFPACCLSLHNIAELFLSFMRWHSCKMLLLQYRVISLCEKAGSVIFQVVLKSLCQG